MTPAARVNAAIELMDQIGRGALADRALTAWGRKNRFAGSKDRAAIADLIYGVLRRKRSCARMGGGETGRALLLGYLRCDALDPEMIFGADRYAPEALSAAERMAGEAYAQSEAEALDWPEWLWPELQRSLGDQAAAVARSLRDRAPVFLRVNLRHADPVKAIKQLQNEGIEVRPHPLSPTALEVIEGPRKIKGSAAYLEGMVELQDASSQAVADMVPLSTGDSLLDYCAGGGGKSLALAGRVNARFFAHDQSQDRMKDVPARAARAGVDISLRSTAKLSGQMFNSVLVDAPCSGSGSWRRDPQGKWLLDEKALNHVLESQRHILHSAAQYVLPGGHLIYATCSVLGRENETQVDAFLDRSPGFALRSQRRFSPLEGGDGFYCAVLRKQS